MGANRKAGITAGDIFWCAVAVVLVALWGKYFLGVLAALARRFLA